MPIMRTLSRDDGASIRAVVGILNALSDHDETAGLPLLNRLPDCLVACCEADPVTPLRHSLNFCEHLTNARLLTVARAPAAAERPSQGDSMIGRWVCVAERGRSPVARQHNLQLSLAMTHYSCRKERARMRLDRPMATVTPTLDGDILAVLARTTTTFTITQIHRILGNASAEGIRKALLRLTAQGIVHSDRVGTTNTYILNTEHLAAQPIRELANIPATFLSRLENHLNAWPEPPMYAAVFGSAATATMTLDSDIDLFLVRPNPLREDPADEWGQQVAVLVESVTAWTGNDTRVVEYTEGDLRHAAAAGEPLLHDVAEHGVTVAGTRSWLTKQLAAGAAATGAPPRSPRDRLGRNTRGRNRKATQRQYGAMSLLLGDAQ